jgi:hypothetical protein
MNKMYIDESDPCWSGYEMIGMKKKGGRKVPNCVPINEADGYCPQCLVEYIERSVNESEYITLAAPGLNEAEYQGRTVKLGKPMRGDVKKFKVYVRNAQGNVVKVNFGHGGTSAKRAGQKTMRIRKSNPARRRSFRARHNCENPGPRWKARYWSCRAW